MSNSKISYRTKSPFAEGGMALLYSIITSDGQSAILRELRGRYVFRFGVRARFIRGLKIRASLTPHPNLANSLEMGSSWFKPYEIIEKVPGCNLRILINRRDEAIRIHREELLIAAAKGLAYMHQDQILHLDVKPENFLVDTADRVNPVVKLTDFDLACPVEQARSTRRVGTPAYMAPEQLRSKISLKTSDVFAFGVMSYQLCSGRFPFSGNSEQQTLRNQSDETTKPRPLSDFVKDISPRLERVIMRSLAKRTQERYPDMNAFLNDLTG
jgi:serine/threonine protein kinase